MGEDKVVWTGVVGRQGLAGEQGVVASPLSRRGKGPHTQH